MMSPPLLLSLLPARREKRPVERRMEEATSSSSACAVSLAPWGTRALDEDVRREKRRRQSLYLRRHRMGRRRRRRRGRWIITPSPFLPQVVWEGRRLLPPPLSRDPKKGKEDKQLCSKATPPIATTSVLPRGIKWKINSSSSSGTFVRMC